MTDQNDRSSKAKSCQAAGCVVDLKGLGKAYHLKKRLCPEHMAAEAITKKGSAGQWRFCQQCGSLEPLHQFEGTKRSCRSGLQRRRDIAAAGKKRQQQQSCQADEHLSGPSHQASSHHAIAGCQADEHLSGLQGQAGDSFSGLGLDATWDPSLAAAAAAASSGVCYRSDNNSGRFLPMTTTPSISQDLVLSSPATSVTEPATATAAPMHQTAEAPYAAPLQGMAAAAAVVSHASNVCSQRQVPQQHPVGLPSGWQPAAAAAAATTTAAVDAAWTAATAPAAPGLSVEWQPAAAAPTATAAAVHPGFGVFQASPVDLQPWTAAAAAAAPSHSLWCAGFDAADAALLDEIGQQLLLELNTAQQQQQAAAGHFAPRPPPAAAAAVAAAAEMSQSEQERRELSRAATLARLQELSREFAVLQQALQDGLAADLAALQCGQIAPQLQQQQQQQAHGGVMGSASMQSYGRVWQF